MGIINTVSRVISKSFTRVANSISRGFNTGMKSTLNFVKTYTAQGYYAAAEMTMGDSSHQRTAAQTTIKYLITKFLLSPAYIVGFILGVFFVPLAYYTYINFSSYFNFTSKKLKEYTDTTNTNNYIKSPKYDGGPIKIFGILGVAFGLTLGTLFITLPTIIFYHIIPETFKSMIIWGKNGLKIAVFDTKKFDLTEEKRRNLSIFFGYFPVGIPFALISLVITAGTLTFVRFIYNTWQSLVNNTIRGYNLAYLDERKIEDDIYYKDRTYYQSFVLGSLGFIIGIATGVLVSIGTTIIRAIGNSAYNFYKTFSVGFSLLIKDLDESRFNTYKFSLDFSSWQSIKNTFKPSYAENVLGALGYFLAPAAFLLGAGCRIAFESFFSTIDAAIILINRIALRGRKNSQGQAFEDTALSDRKFYNRIIGILGFPVGLLLTVIPAAIIGIVRYGATNIDSGRRVFNFFTKDILPIKENFKKDLRPSWVKALSFPGASLGITIGGGVKWIAETYFNFINTCKLWLKTSLNHSPKYIYNSNYLKISNSDRKIYNRTLGGIGYLVGALFITTPVIIIFLGRFVITNADSAKRSFASSVNPKLQEKLQIKLESDERNQTLKFIGYPGNFLGFIIGQIGLVSVETVIYFEYTFKSIITKALYEMESPLINEIKIPEILNHSKILGLLGIIFGGVTGVLSFLGIGCGRVIFNTLQTSYHVILDMIKFVRIQGEIPSKTEFAELARLYNIKPENPNQANLRVDIRKNTPFKLGLLGLPLGGTIGLFSAVFIGSFRIIKETLILTYNNILYFSRLALPKDDKYNLNKYQFNQTSIDTKLGYIGYVLGVILGGIGYISCLTTRCILDTIVSIGIGIIKTTNLPPVNYDDNYIDNREGFDKKLGFLGMMFGLVLGISIYALRIIANIFYHSWANIKRNVINLVLWSKGDPDEDYILGINDTIKGDFITLKSNRTNFEKLAFGLPGNIIGKIIGTIIGFLIITVRFLGHNLKSGALAFQETSNLVNKKKWKFANNYKYDTNIDKIQFLPINIPLFFKHIAALPGNFIGVIFATILVISPYYLKKFVNNNWLSFKHFSKSIINSGLEDFYFEDGVQADKRSWKEKVVGGCGYILALPFLIIPLANNLWKASWFLVAFSASLIIVPYKLFLIICYPRFTGEEKDEKIQRIKELYSALEAGEYSKNTKIIKGKNGGKGFFDFLRKATSFNLNTITEDILAAELEHAKNSNFNLESEISEIKKNNYGLFFSNKKLKEKQQKEVEKTIETTRSIVENYIQKEEFSYKPNTTKDKSFFDFFRDSAANNDDDSIDNNKDKKTSFMSNL